MKKYIFTSVTFIMCMYSCAQEQNHDAKYYKELGKSLSAEGDKQEAIKAYTKAIELNPQYDTAYYNRGVVKSNLGNKKGAIEDYDKAIEINPHFAVYYNNRGIAKSAIGDFEGEIHDYHMAIRINPTYYNAYNNLGRALYDLKRFKEAAEAYGEGISHFPEDCGLYYGRGLARNQSGDKKGACEDWRKSSALGCLQANLLLPLCEDCED
ncbi:MAG: tetratricopeptide repeat protein [Bacteroides sp.]|nr:tetratricopeptide repeat protein [Bacteroides sp.]